MDARSESYLMAAQKLRDVGKYNTATALAYYAAFMYMRYVWAHASAVAKDYENQNPLNEEIHKRVFQSVKNYLETNNGNGRGFEILVDELFALRKKADYEQGDVGKTECGVAVDCAEKLIKMMKGLPLKTNYTFKL